MGTKPGYETLQQHSTGIQRQAHLQLLAALTVFVLLTSFPCSPFLSCFNYYYIIIFYLNCPTRTGDHSCLPGRAAAGRHVLHGRRTTVLYIEEL